MSSKDTFWSIPTFKIVAHPNESLWSDRVKEEINIFKNWRDRCLALYRYAPFDNLCIGNSDRQFICIFQFPESDKKSKVEILIPRDYPKVPPRVKWDLSRFPFVKFEISDISPTLVFLSVSEEPCLGVIEATWKRDGTCGIAHYLSLLCNYVSILL